MENAKCILCGANAKRKSLKIISDLTEAAKDSGGYGYRCDDCGLYALNHPDCIKIEKFASDECKKKLAEYVKSNPDKEGKFKVITWNEIKKICDMFR